MKFSHVLPLAAATSAFIIPAENVFSQIPIEFQKEKDTLASEAKSYYDTIAHATSDAWNSVAENSREAYRGFQGWADETKESMDQAASDFEDWISQESDFDLFGGHHGEPPHHGKPPKHGKPPHHDKPPHHGKHPHHGSNLTVYQLIAESKYTTKLARLINKFPDIVEGLNSTKANYTIFAPIDEAFEHIPHDIDIPDDELKAILAYHVIPDLYPAKRVLTSYTAPTLLKVGTLSDKHEPQRLAFKLGFRGLAVNFYSRVVAVNIFGTNGVIHGVKSIIVPPPNAATIIGLLPGEFSTLELGLVKTGLADKLNTTKHHDGGTLFAPSNFAFQKLGPRVNGFLFSQYGEKYLKALLKYHVVQGTTLYSDALYQSGGKKDEIDMTTTGKFHIDLPTLLKGKSLSVDIATWGSWVSIHINGFSRVTVGDGVALDGVIHGVSNVLIPPKTLSSGIEQQWDGEELTVEDLVERLEPFVPKGDL